LLKSSHIAAVLVAYLCGVALPRLRVHSCGCDDLTSFEQPKLTPVFGVFPYPRVNFGANPKEATMYAA